MITPQRKTIGIPLIYALESNLSKVYNFCNWIISRLMPPIYQTHSLKFDWELNCFVDFWPWRNSINLIFSRKCVAALDQGRLNCKWSLIILSPHCANKAPPYHIEQSMEFLTASHRTHMLHTIFSGNHIHFLFCCDCYIYLLVCLCLEQNILKGIICIMWTWTWFQLEFWKSMWFWTWMRILMNILAPNILNNGKITNVQFSNHSAQFL